MVFKTLSTQIISVSCVSLLHHGVCVMLTWFLSDLCGNSGTVLVLVFKIA